MSSFQQLLDYEVKEKGHKLQGVLTEEGELT